MKKFIKNFEKFQIAYNDDNQPNNFHDSEIISIFIERKNPPYIQVKVKLISYVKFLGEFIKDEKKFSKWKKAEFELVFKDAYLENLEGFNHQNVVNDLYISINDNIYDVWFESIFGCELKLECKEIELTEIEIFEIESEKFEPSEETIQKIREARKKLNG